MLRSRLNVGSLVLHLSVERSLYPDTLAEIFCAAAKPIEENASNPDAEICFVEPGDPGFRPPPGVAVPPDGMVIIDSPPSWEIHTEALCARLFPNEAPLRVLVTVLNPGMAEYDLRVHVTVVLFKVLFLIGCLALHAAAVDFEGCVNVFLGGKGAGKSTTALRLALAGGAVLGEDRVILKKAGGRFFVSGGGDKSRVTEKTERHFFSAPLQTETRDVGGVLKKEFPVGGFFSSIPYRDYAPDRLFFNQVGVRFGITPLSRSEALVELVRETKASHRFAGTEDYRRYLTYLRECVDAVPAFRLELSQDLTELDNLVAFLRARR